MRTRSIARPLAESLRHEVVCREHDIVRYVPDPPDGPIGIDRALGLALQRIKDAQVDTRWTSASLPGAPSDPLPTDPRTGQPVQWPACVKALRSSAEYRR